MNNKIKISTLTEFGVALRKLRLDYGERMGDMAERLHFSTAYLSAIENGRQSIPHSLLDRIRKAYPLSEEQKKSLCRAYSLTVDAFVLPLDGLDSGHRLITSFFASRLAELDAKQIETVADALGCGEEFSALLARHTKDGQQQIDIS